MKPLEGKMRTGLIVAGAVAGVMTAITVAVVWEWLDWLRTEDEAADWDEPL